MKYNGFVKVQAFNKNIMTTKSPYNLLVKKPRTNLDKILGKHIITEGLVRSVRKFAKSVTKISTKVQVPRTYDEAINNSVHRKKWQEVIDEKLWNLNSYQTWNYIALPSEQKAISYKQRFKVKYHSNDSIERYKISLVT